MKSTPKTKRIIFDAGKNENLLVFGIVSAEPDYKLSLALNRKMGISLRNTDPLCISEDSVNELSFSRFRATGKTGEVLYELVSNRSGSQFLLKKLKNIDFFLKVNLPQGSAGAEISARLKQTEAVSAVFIIDKDTLNDKNLHYLIQ